MSAGGTGGEQGLEEEEEDVGGSEEEESSSFHTAAHGMFHSQGLKATRAASATDADVEYEDVAFIVFESLIKASDYLKIPTETLQVYLSFAEANGGMLMSFRDKKSLQTITKRRSDLSILFYNKPGPVKTKMNSTFPKGHIPRDRSLLTHGVAYDVGDNSYGGTFPDGSASTLECVQLRELLRTHEQKYHPDDAIHEVRKIGNRICYSEYVAQYEKGDTGYVVRTKEDTKAVTKLKHYIQEVESLHSILKNIARGIYTDAKIDGDKLRFNYADQELSINISEVMPVEIQDKLKDLLSIAKTTAGTMAFIDGSKVEGMKQRGEIINEMDKKLFAVSKADKLDGCACPFWYSKSTGAKKVELPVMVMSGDNGYEIASDLDILQLPAPFGLPTSMHTLCITSKNYKQLDGMFDKAIDELDKEIAKLSDSDTRKKVFIDLLEEVKAAQKYYFEDTDPEDLMGKLSVLGTTNVYGITKQFIFNRDNNFDPNTPWPHGADDLHPAPSPENFGAVIMLNDGTISYIGNEKAYVLYLLHDPDILQNESNELSIHPYWLTTDDEEHEYWQQIVYIQALYAMKLDIARGIAPPGEKYFANLLIKASLDSRKPPVIEAAAKVIASIQEKVKKIDPKEIDGELKKAYTKPLKSSEDSEILRDIQTKAQVKQSAGSELS